jgi:hypothetical protein
VTRAVVGDNCAFSFALVLLYVLWAALLGEVVQSIFWRIPLLFSTFMAPDITTTHYLVHNMFKNNVLNLAVSVFHSSS